MRVPARIATPREVPERLFAAETAIASLVEDREDMRRAIRAWTLALVIAMLGAGGTVLAAAVAYGELRQTAAQNAASLSEVRSELAATRALLARGRE